MKRILDVVVASFGLIVCAPLLLILIILVRVKLGSPVFFCQVRPGIKGRPFTMLKFRTMTDARDANGRMLPDERRLTSFGRLLRATSMDELPELWNVLRGEMSIVGPRPLLMEYLPLYSPQQARRHEVRPGVTGCGTRVQGEQQAADFADLAAGIRFGEPGKFSAQGDEVALTA